MTWSSMKINHHQRLGVLLLGTLALGVICGGCKSKVSSKPIDRSTGQIPLLKAVQLKAGRINVDGRLDEGAWKKAAGTGPFVQSPNGMVDDRSPVQATGKIMWDARYLYVGCVVHDAWPVSPFKRGEVDPHIWKRSSAVELMIQPGDQGDNRYYYEIQVDVSGAVWDTRFDDYNRPITRAGGRIRYGHQEWSSRIRRAVVIDRQAGKYTMELALPWAAFEGLAKNRPGVSVPPRPGDSWRANLYSFRDGQRASLAWSPILRRGNFHRTSRFGIVKFLGQR